EGLAEHFISISSFTNAYIMTSSAPRRLDANGSMVRVVDAEFTASRYRLLCTTDAGAYVFAFATAADLLSSVPFFAADGSPAAGMEVTGPFWLSDERAWLTANGVVALQHDRRTSLVRFAYADAPAADAAVERIDELIFNESTEDYSILGFDEQGKWWFLFDRWNGYLYRMRTWW
ncbi:MAG: hypothetical protein JXM71_08220, partial [Spirochaetales bacterium]|nr:hypothetical protein [Spirochaetales bacterium]